MKIFMSLMEAYVSFLMHFIPCDLTESLLLNEVTRFFGSETLFVQSGQVKSWRTRKSHGLGH